MRSETGTVRPALPNFRLPQREPVGHGTVGLPRGWRRSRCCWFRIRPAAARPRRLRHLPGNKSAAQAHSARRAHIRRMGSNQPMMALIGRFGSRELWFLGHAELSANRNYRPRLPTGFFRGYGVALIPALGLPEPLPSPVTALPACRRFRRDLAARVGSAHVLPL